MWGNTFPDIGKRIRLQGRTLRGKNRIYRGGDEWLVVQVDLVALGYRVESLDVGPRESFWIYHPVDEHMEVVHVHD